MTKSPKQVSKKKPEPKKRWFRKFSIFYHKPHMVPIFTLLILIAISAAGFGVYRLQHRNQVTLPDTRIVIISHDHQKQVVPSNDATVGTLLNKLSIHLNQGDRVEPALTTKIDQDEFRINIYRAVPIEIVDGSQKTFAFSAATTPRSIATESGEVLYAEDNLKSVPTENFIKDGALGQRVVVDRATPVALNLYGTPVVTRTHAKTIRDMLKEKGIKLTKGDQLVPAPTTPLSDNIQVAIIRNGTKTESVTEDIAMPIQTVNDASLAYGTSAVRQAGAPGKKVVTYQEDLKNNQVVTKTAIQEVIIQQPVTQIDVVGTSLSGIKGDMAYAGINPSEYAAADYIISHESGWCPTKAQGQYGGCPPYSGSVSSYGGYGLCQSTPGSKMASAGADWATNPVTQLKWCTGYAVGRYGSWSAAYNHWLNNHNW